MAKFKTRPRTPKEELLKGESPSPKVASPAKKAPPAHGEPPKPREPQKGKRGCGIGIGGCFLGTCLGILITIVIIIGGISFAGQALLSNLPPELRERFSSQEGIIELLESLQTEGGLQKLLEEGFEKPQPFLIPVPEEFRETSPSASPSARPSGF